MIGWILATLCAFYIKGLCGFANTLIFTTILSFTNSNLSISPVELILGYPTNLIIAWKERQNVKWQVCLPLAVCVILGNIPGILLLKTVNTQMIKVLFGMVIVSIGINMLLGEKGKRAGQPSKVLLLIIGILSGILSGLYGIGALLAVYVNRLTDDSHAFKANLCIVFIIENTFRILLYTSMGILTGAVIKQGLLLMPFMLAGLWAGMKSGDLLDEKIIKKLVIVMLILSGLALIVGNLSFLSLFQ